MLALINRILDWFKSLFWKEEMELTLVGLQYSGKTTFVNVIAVRESWILLCLSPSLALAYLGVAITTWGEDAWPRGGPRDRLAAYSRLG